MNEDNQPWYRQFWPWFLIALPATAVVAGIATVIIAVNNHVDLVKDETTKLGKMVTTETRQDDTAREMGLKATVHLVPQTGTLAVEVSTLPDEVILEVVHATLAEKDQQIHLRREPDGLFRGQLQPLQAGKWELRLSDVKHQWRLTAPYNGLDDQVELRPKAH